MHIQVHIQVASKKNLYLSVTVSVGGQSLCSCQPFSTCPSTKTGTADSGSYSSYP